MTNGICKRIFLKGNTMSAAQRAEFSSDLYASGTEDEEFVPPHSPTDSSEDSVEVKVNPITLRSKRKGVEPRKLNNNGPIAPPPKKRICLQISEEEQQQQQRKNAREPFRPWNVSENKQETGASKTELSKPTNVFSPHLVPPHIHHVNLHHNPVSLNIPTFAQPAANSNAVKEEPKSPSIDCPESPTEPLSLVKKSSAECDNKREDIPSTVTNPFGLSKIENMRVPYHPPVVSMATVETERALQQSSEIFPTLKIPSSSAEVAYKKMSDLKKPTISVRSFESHSDNSAKKEQRNYKNMTRERRIEANARERTRVHTISAAFDTLRKSIPSYSHNQKLSKLSVLRIACSYIATLSNIVSDSDQDALEECVENVTKTIQREGKLRKKKDESD